MKIFKPSFLINLEKCILWQYDKATKLSNLIIEKEKWYKQNVTEFIVNFFINIFNLKTANDFGLNVWGKLLSFPRQITLNKYQVTILDRDGQKTDTISLDRTTFNAKIASGDDFTAMTVEQGKKYTFEFRVNIGSGYYVSVYDNNGNTIVNKAPINSQGGTAPSPSYYGLSGYSVSSSGVICSVVTDYTPLNLSTEQYRFLLLGQVLKFKMSCTIPEVNRYLRLIFNEEDNKNVYVIDNHNMTITYNIEPSSLSDEIRLLIENYDFLPAPAGVRAITGLGEYFTLKIVPSPSNALVRLFINGEEISATNNEITVKDGTVVDYRVSADGFDEKTGSVEINGEDVTENVTLETTLTINATPSSSTITLILNGTTYTATGSITKTVTYGNSYSYTVSKEGYIEEGEENQTITGQRTININLQESGATLSLTGLYKSNGGVETKKTFIVNRTAEYKIELGGDRSYENASPNYYKKGGSAVLQTTFNQGDVLKIKIMYGGYRSSAGNNFGGVGVGLWVNDVCKLAVGGGGFGLGAIAVGEVGGGGYEGGTAGYSKGFSYNGQRGNYSGTGAGAGGGDNNGRGGSGYVASEYASVATLTYNNNNSGFARITYIG